jgi:hypothetical protein
MACMFLVRYLFSLWLCSAIMGACSTNLLTLLDWMPASMLLTIIITIVGLPVFMKWTSDVRIEGKSFVHSSTCPLFTLQDKNKLLWRLLSYKVECVCRESFTCYWPEQKETKQRKKVQFPFVLMQDFLTIGFLLHWPLHEKQKSNLQLLSWILGLLFEKV